MEDSMLYNTTTGDDTAALIVMGPMMLFYAALAIVMVVAMWRVFTKAGKPGWAAIIPIYNSMVLAEIVGRPGWVGLLNLIPFINIYISIILALDLAKAFGKDVVFGVLTIFFPFVMYPILGFGSSRYVGPAVQGITIEP